MKILFKKFQITFLQVIFQNVEVKSTKVSFYKIDYNRFEIQFPFDRSLVELCKEIPGLEFTDNKRWSFPIKYESLLKKFQNFEIGNELNQNQIDDTRVVILDEDL